MRCNYQSSGACAGEILFYSRDDGKNFPYCDRHLTERLDAQKRDEEALERAYKEQWLSNNGNIDY